MAYAKPLPKPTKEDREFWQAAKEHRLVLPRCRDCGYVWFPPYLACGRCLSSNREWVTASGRATVWGYVEMAHPYIPSFAPEIPYNVVLVKLDEGPLMFSNVVSVANSAIHTDMPVEAVFEDVTPEFTLIKFKPRQQR